MTVQLALPSPTTAYLLGRAFTTTGITPSSRVGQAAEARPTQLSRARRSSFRVLQVDLDQGTTATLVTRLLDAGGMAVRRDEGTAYITCTSAGQVLAIDLHGGRQRVIVASGLTQPGKCAWFDEDRGLLLVVEHGGVAILNVTTGAVRHLLGCPGSPTAVARIGQRVVVAAGTAVAAIHAAAVEPNNVTISGLTMPLHVGGYARFQVDLGSSGLAFEDLRFDIEQGSQYGQVSLSRDDLFDPTHPTAILLAGPHAGVYMLRASDLAGTEVATTAFTITDRSLAQDGPPIAFTGANPLYASGGAWGSLWNGVFPQKFTYGPNAVSGTRRVALVFVETKDTTLPAGVDVAYEKALSGGVLGSDGVSRSAASYFQEVSGKRLAVVLAGRAKVILPGAWSDYTREVVRADGWRTWGPTPQLHREALADAQADIDFTAVDIVVFVVASPNGGLPDPQVANGEPRFIWPQAHGGTFVFHQPPSVSLGWWWKPFPWTTMPAEWQAVDGRQVHETLTHELCHNIGLTDLYGDERAVGAYDLMDTDDGMPSLTLPHRTMLGWVDPTHLRTYNFRTEKPVDESITLTAAELLGENPPPTGERAGAVVELADGWRYYLEYRSRQNQTAADPGPTQVADQQLPADRRVLGLDVAAGTYHSPVTRKPIRWLLDDGDGQGAALAVGEDYEELDVDGNATFRVEVVDAGDDRATVHISYQPAPVPEPWPNGPDPSIRPWPGGNAWRSPDVYVTNFGGVHPFIPWAGHDNIITARVTNSGTVDAVGVRVDFWVKHFTVVEVVHALAVGDSAGAAEATGKWLGFATADIPAGSWYNFAMRWKVPAHSGPTASGFGIAHYSLVARIAPHTQGSPARGEVNPDNNKAQTNYTVVWTASSSPFTRQRVPVVVANPYGDQSALIHLHAEQRLDWFRTYLEHETVLLGPAEQRTVEVMVECIADQAPFADTVPLDEVFAEPNIVTVVASVFEPGLDSSTPLGGGTIEVRAGRASLLVDLDVARTHASGRVIRADDGSPVSAGGIVLLSATDRSGREMLHNSAVSASGTFALYTPNFDDVPDGAAIDVTYCGDVGFAPTATRVHVP